MLPVPVPFLRDELMVSKKNLVNEVKHKKNSSKMLDVRVHLFFFLVLQQQYAVSLILSIAEGI